MRDWLADLNKKSAAMFLLLSILGVPTLYVAGFMSGIPDEMRSAVPNSFIATLIRDFIIHLTISGVISRFAVILASSMLKIFSYTTKQATNASQFKGRRFRLILVFTRKVFKKIRALLAATIWALTFVLFHLGASVTENFAISAALILLMITFAVWLTNFYSITPNKATLTGASPRRILHSLAITVTLTALYLSHSLGQNKFIYLSLSCNRISLIDQSELLSSPVAYTDTGLILVHRIRTGTPFSLFSAIKAVDASFVPFSSISSVSTSSPSKSSAVIDKNGANYFRCMS